MLVESKSLAGVHMYAAMCEQTFGKRPERVQLLYLSRPEAIIKRINGLRMEPVEHLTVDVREENLGAVTEALGSRGAWHEQAATMGRRPGPRRRPDSEEVSIPCSGRAPAR